MTDKEYTKMLKETDEVKEALSELKKAEKDLSKDEKLAASKLAHAICQADKLYGDSRIWEQWFNSKGPEITNRTMRSVVADALYFTWVADYD